VANTNAVSYCCYITLLELVIADYGPIVGQLQANVNIAGYYCCVTLLKLVQAGCGPIVGQLWANANVVSFYCCVTLPYLVGADCGPIVSQSKSWWQSKGKLKLCNNSVQYHGVVAHQ
jgi:hypothetical protein